MQGHIAWQWCIMLGCGELLSVGQDPPQKLYDRLALLVVLNLFRDQKPGETRDRIRLFVLRVRDRHAEIAWHIDRCGRGGRCDGSGVRPNELTDSVLDDAELNVVLNRVGQL